MKEIKSVLENPALDRKSVLQMQRKMLVIKKERMERLIAGIDDILKGDNTMDFTIFSRAELEELFQAMYDSLTGEMQQTAVEEFGGLTQWKEHYVHVMSAKDAQERCAKMVEWYGGKDAYLSAVQNPPSREVAESYKRREDAILQKLTCKRGCPLNSFEVKEIIGEYGFVMKQLCQVKEEKGLMLSLAASYRNERVKPEIDRKYGEGAAEFFAQAIETFYA